MSNFVIYFCLFSCQFCGITAFDNLAFGRNVTGYQDLYVGKPLQISGNLTDGDRTGTCEHFSGDYFEFHINLQKMYTIKSSRLIFKGNFTTNGANIFCYDDTRTWPYYELGSYRRENPQTVKFEAQRTGTTIYFYVWVPSSNTIEIELCEIEMYGCEVDHYGDDCLPCNKSDNCKVCDVNNGACYVCKKGYTGSNCSR
ncbi:uncharacterized protein LOC134248960, partial [Saccostrea cucullata]|uniref:uncharacterized protein LOC134248960 n=1 Tax=Saccostrea cuccullata TaxID=36930 RepID=UPI002ED480B9